jgi:murein DD-endopeptidase MepM/ murein hydrolase activator NlpD
MNGGLIVGPTTLAAGVSTDRLAAGVSAGGPAGRAAGAAESPGDKRVTQLAAEFESMLLLQMLREMRAAGSWKAEGDDEGLGAEALFESLDTELAAHLATTRGFGLANVLGPALAPLAAEGTGPAMPTGRAFLSAPPRLSPEPASGFAPAAPPAALLGGAPAATSSAAPVDAAGAAVGAGVGAGVSVSRAAVTSPFGWRHDPFHGGARFHRGVDVRAAYGEAVVAAAPGTVVFAGEQGGYGNTVVVEHAGGLKTRYAHLSSVVVGSGDQVEAGADLGRAGRSGRATGTHLHFEVTRSGRAVDPADAGFAGGLLAPLKFEPGVADVGVARDPSPGGRPS